ncbi:MAG: hypothetical protein U0228_09610 [Myxococcaceae bacterium]
MTLALVLTLISAAAPCERVVLFPLAPVATTPQVAREQEDRVRQALEANGAWCVEPRAETIKRVLALEGHRLAECRDVACTAQQLESLGVDLLVTGTVFGVGGKPTLELGFARATGTSRATGAPEELPALLALAREAPRARSHTRWPSFLTGGLGLGGLGTGVALGVMSASTSRALSTGVGPCTGVTGSTFVSCVDQQFQGGRDLATAANVLYVIGGALLGTAVVLWVVDLP